MSSGTQFPLGLYVGNPNGNDATEEQSFERQYDSFVQAMGGARPQFMDAFVDFTQDPSQWGANASWTAWSWAQTGTNYVAPGSGATPVIGVPMASNAGGWSNVDQFYKSIISGQYDADYKSVVDAWAQQGYTTIDLRLGYEFNGNFMAWAPGNSSSPTANADFVAAWRHLANLAHAEGKADGITVNTVWNPDDINWSAAPPASLYPGDQYVDIIATDAYSPVYPRDLTDWATGGTTQDASLQQWFANATNREHYWQYTDANYWNPSGDGSGWSFQDAVNFAKAHGKPLALGETGAGGDGSSTGPVDDPAFPQWLANSLSQAQAQGVPVAFVNIWDDTLSDGDWRFSGAGSDKPMEAAAWAKYFGAGSAGSGGSSGSTPPPPPAPNPGAQTIDQSATVATDQVFVPDMSAWAAASPTHPIATKIGSHVYNVIGAESDGNTGGMLTTSTKVALADNQWGETVSIASDPPGSGSSGSGSSSGATPPPPSTQTIDQSATAATKQVFVPDASAWAAASPTHPVATKIGSHVYNVIGAGSDGNTGGMLTTSTKVALADNQWGETASILAASSSPILVTTALPVATTAAGQSPATISVSGPSGSYSMNASGTRNGDVFLLNDANRSAIVHTGSANESMSFHGWNSILLETGTGKERVSADQGRNTFKIGVGGATIRGGAGADTYVLAQNSGALTIEDFLQAKGDVLTAPAGLEPLLQEHSTPSGVVLSFGKSHTILLAGVSSFNTHDIHWSA